MYTINHVLVRGATGHCAIDFINQVLNDPSCTLQLTLFVRNAAKLSSTYLTNDRITVIEGGLSDTTSLTTAMQGHVDAVVSFLGAYITLTGFLTRDRSTPIANSFPALFDAMRAHNVKRILVLSTSGGYLIPQERMPWTWWLINWFIPEIITPAGVAEIGEIAMHTTKQADIDWTVFRVPHLNDGDADLKVEAGFFGVGKEEYKGSFELSRRSLGRWVIEELREGRWIGRCPVVKSELGRDSIRLMQVSNSVTFPIYQRLLTPDWFRIVVH